MRATTIKLCILLLLFVGFTNLQSCTKKAPEEPKVKPEPEPEPEPEKNLSYSYSSETIQEFNLYHKDQSKSSFEATEQSKFFKNRPKYFRPQTMKFKDDSLFISKLGDYKEAYKIKWENEKLLIYQDEDKSWKHFADKNDKNQLSLNIVLYNSELKSANSNAVRTGQLYNPISIHNILSDQSSADMKTIWLKINTIYSPEKN